MVARKPPTSLITRVLRSWWRLTRGLTLGAQGAVIDRHGQILLVRHGYRPGWFFPGGGVERYETIEESLAREVLEETGVELTGEPVLHGLFANIERFPGDHIAVFVVRDWRRAHAPRPNIEIAEQGFFATDALPEDTDSGTRRRLDEILNDLPQTQKW